MSPARESAKMRLDETTAKRKRHRFVSGARERVLTREFLTLAGVAFLLLLSVGLVIPILPRYVEGPLRGGSVAVGLTVGVFNAAAVLVRPFMGRIADKRSRKVLILAGPAAMGIGFAGMLLDPPLGTVLGLRVFQGVGEAAFFVGGLTSVTDIAPASRRAEAVSFFSVGVFLGLGIGPATGEALYARFGFPGVWLAAALVAAAGLVIASRVSDTHSGQAPDAVPLVHVGALLPGSVLGLGIIGLAGFNAFIPLYAPTLGLHNTGRLFAAYSAVVLVMRILAASVPDRLGYVRTSRLAMSCMAAGMLTIALAGRPAGLYAGAVLLALGVSMNWPAMSSLVIARTSPAERGSVMGTFTAFFDLGQGAGAVALGWIVAVSGYEAAFVAAGVGALAGVALVGRLRTKADRSAGGDHPGLTPRSDGR